MPHRNLRALLILGVVIAITGGLVLWRMAVSRRTVETASGNTIRLAGYHFSTNKVPYALPHTVREWWIDGFDLESPDREEIVKPAIPGVPVLGAAFTFDRAPSSLRLVIADSAGRAFDPIVHEGSIGKRDWVTETSFFPRRAKRLHLRLMQEDRRLGQFTIPNPAHSDYGTWKTETLPVTKTNWSSAITLTGFAVHHPDEDPCSEENVNLLTRFDSYPRTEYTFRIKRNGRITSGFRPTSFKVRDVTGNLLRRSAFDPMTSTDRGKVTGGFLGALWKSQSAWETEVEFRQVEDFSEDQTLTLESLPAPSPGGLREPDIERHLNDARLRVEAVIGLSGSSGREPGRESDRIASLIGVLLSAEARGNGRLDWKYLKGVTSDGMKLSLRDKVDRVPADRVPIFARGVARYRLRREILGRKSVLLKIGATAPMSRFNLTVALTKRHTITFLAKPEHVGSQMGD